MEDLPSPRPPDDAVEFIPRERFLEARLRGTYGQAASREFIARSIRACADRRLDLGSSGRRGADWAFTGGSSPS